VELHMTHPLTMRRSCLSACYSLSLALHPDARRGEDGNDISSASGALDKSPPLKATSTHDDDSPEDCDSYCEGHSLGVPIESSTFHQADHARDDSYAFTPPFAQPKVWQAQYPQRV